MPTAFVFQARIGSLRARAFQSARSMWAPVFKHICTDPPSSIHPVGNSCSLGDLVHAPSLTSVGIRAVGVPSLPYGHLPDQLDLHLVQVSMFSATAIQIGHITSPNTYSTFLTEFQADVFWPTRTISLVQWCLMVPSSKPTHRATSSSVTSSQRISTALGHSVGLTGPAFPGSRPV